MYLDYYGLRERPFSLSPNPKFFYPSSAHSAALDHLEYGLTQNLGFILLSGEIGSGKTTLLRRVHSHLGPETEIAIVFNTNLSPSELLKLVLQEFELDSSGDKADLLDRLNDYLISRFAAGKNTVLVIDEAQNLSIPALEEVRMLSNLQTETTPLLQIVLAGQPELAERMRSPELLQLAQRITVHYHLTPLSREETGQYVNHRLLSAGRTGNGLFDSTALDLIHAESGGIPRIINNLCDAALVAGFADGLETLSGDVVREVVEERRKSGCPISVLLADGRKDVALGHVDDSRSPVLNHEELTPGAAPSGLGSESPVSAVVEPPLAPQDESWTANDTQPSARFWARLRRRVIRKRS
ncbi:ExeA family protein [Desulfovibrio ferrophilus]|uniref:Secretion ATPase, PEP-CTERM locus subfamily n=1 Tax=Desulfovibrio ferrophilus TaxID=241368 RepID=A0A2Z6B1G3_9BACT|nr:AAA family ATPase [Desulfovibrio ferrophilus]BBD09270.1 secretion ATPase, PEP-CTERM locus subfamily [Desulfovibrio ferrophilus]